MYFMFFIYIYLAYLILFMILLKNSVMNLRLNLSYRNCIDHQFVLHSIISSILKQKERFWVLAISLLLLILLILN